MYYNWCIIWIYYNYYTEPILTDEISVNEVDDTVLYGKSMQFMYCVCVILSMPVIFRQSNGALFYCFYTMYKLYR